MWKSDDNLYMGSSDQTLTLPTEQPYQPQLKSCQTSTKSRRSEVARRSLEILLLHICELEGSHSPLGSQAFLGLFINLFESVLQLGRDTIEIG